MRGILRRCAPGGTRHPLGGLGADSAWRYVSPARRFVLLQLGNFGCEIVIYKTSSSALKVGLLVFLELWLGTYPLSCDSG